MSVKIRYEDQPDGPPIKHLTCACGLETTLDHGSDWNCSRCRQEYNAFGQALAPREQWEERDDSDDPETPHYPSGNGTNSRDFVGPMDWNDTSNPRVREAERDERRDMEGY